MSKIKELKEKNPNFVIDLIQLMSERDPSGTNKYLKFMIETSKPFVESYFNSGKFMDQSFIQLFTLIKKFEKYAEENLLEEKDIYAYASVDDIERAIKDADAAAELRSVKTTETLVLFEDADRILVKPLSKRSSATYGKNTKWCTSENDGGSFQSYASEGCLLYFIFKHPPTNLPEQWRKVAFNRKSLSVSGILWNAPDQQISGGDTLKLSKFIGNDVMEIIVRELDLCIPNTSLRKSEDGTIMIDKELFTRDGFRKMHREIEEYVSTLKGNREKGSKKVATFERTKEEKAQLTKTGNQAVQGLGQEIGAEPMAIPMSQPDSNNPFMDFLPEEAVNDQVHPGEIDVTDAMLKVMERNKQLQVENQLANELEKGILKAEPNISNSFEEMFKTEE